MNSPISSALCTALALLLQGIAAHATTTSINTGSLGAAANATNADTVVLGQPGAVTAGGDRADGYSGGADTTLAFQSALNPGAASPFSIEFWSKPSASDNDDAPVANRLTTANRSGWVFFQRDPATGWNFRMYNGAGSATGWDLTGGTAPLNAWSHVVAIWNGSVATLYVNGALADDTNAGGLNGVYNPNTSASILSIGALFDGASASTSLVDEVAFYGSALSPAQVLNHFNLASSPTPGVYNAAVTADGALLHLANNPVPEPASILCLAMGGFIGLCRSRRRS